MSQQLLWINKDPTSRTLSQSSRAEEAKIRQHVALQTKRHRKPAVSNDQTVVDREGCMTGSSPNFQTPSHAKQTGESEQALRSQKRNDGHAPVLPKIPITLTGYGLHLRPLELRSFAFFEARTMRDCPGWMDYSFWSDVVRRLAVESQVVAHSVIAMSAMHESLITSKDAGSAMELRRLSIKQTSAAAHAAILKNLSYMEALTSCIILCCLHGLCEGTIPVNLLKSGMKMLSKHALDDVSTSTQEAAMIEHTIRPLVLSLHCNPCRMGDLSIAFLRSVQKQRGTDAISSSQHTPIAALHAYENLQQAREGLQSILDWCHDTIPLSDSRSDVFRHYRALLKGFFGAWEEALDHVQQPVDAADSSSFRNAKGLLHAASLLGRIIVETCTSSSEMVFDDFLPEFYQIVQYLEAAHSEEESRRISFGIDDGLIDIMAFVGSKCRDPGLRRRAMHLLVTGARREGYRQGLLPAQILGALIDLEECGTTVSNSSDILESDRRVLICGHQFNAKRRIRLVYSTSTSVPDRLAHRDERIVSFDKYYVRSEGPSQLSDAEDEPPDATFGPGFAAFLVDRTGPVYSELHIDQFYFPIPRG